MNFLKRIFSTAAIIIAVGLFIAEPSFQSPMLRAINQQREAFGVPAVREDVLMDRGAQERAIRISDPGEFSHTGFESSINRVLTTYKNFDIGENLGSGYKTEEDITRAWMNSPAHKEIILDPSFRFLGWGVYKDYWVLWMSARE